MPRLSLRRFFLLILAVAVVIYITLFDHNIIPMFTRCPLKESDMEPSMVEYPAMDTRGYMVSFRFYEQQTQGLHNLIQFQCVAYSYGLRVVEPFVTNSMFTIPFQDFLQHEPEDYLKLGDLIDIKMLHKNTSAIYPPLSSWDNFLKVAPRNVIINCIRYRNPPIIHLPKPGFNFRNGCTPQCFKKFNATLTFLSKHGFKLVRKSCSNFVDYPGSVSVDDFGENIFGKHNPANVTVIINEFRGLFGLYRLPLRSPCGLTHESSKMTVYPSLRIMNDARAYSQRTFKGKLYVGVVARVERIILHLHHKIEQCAAEVKGVLKHLAIEKGLSDVFLALDVGKFGSRGANKANLLPKGKVLFDTIYGKEKWTFEEWEQTFSDVASSDNAAYVANLQRTLAAKAECLIMIGGGSFQGQAQNLYERFHPETSRQCVYRVCNSEQTP